MHARPLVDDVTADVRPARLVLAAGVGCILLIACANVANPFLSLGVTAMSGFTLPASRPGGTPTETRQLTYIVTPGYAEALRRE